VHEIVSPTSFSTFLLSSYGSISKDRRCSGSPAGSLTVDPRAIRLDALCYLMHRIDREGRRVS
jgi:hypothetical protein